MAPHQLGSLASIGMHSLVVIRSSRLDIGVLVCTTTFFCRLFVCAGLPDLSAFEGQGGFAPGEHLWVGIIIPSTLDAQMDLF